MTDRITAAGWRIVLLASLGGTLEFYDFVIFGIFARDIADAIFPASSPLASLMASFAAFAAGYLARPIGGIVLSHYGDRYGRRRVFLWSVFVMSGATLGMGLVPSYVHWGVAASATMVALRVVQGFCLGGELPGALTYVVETAPRIAPFVCGVVFACVTMGVAAATGVSLTLRTLLPPEDVPVLAWRLAFVLGGLGGVLSFVLRRSLEESPEFSRMRSLASRLPFRELLGTHARPVLVGCAVLAGTACFNGLFFSHMPAYLAGVLKYDPRQAIYSQTVGVIANAIGILATGWLADRVPSALSAATGRWPPGRAGLSVLHCGRHAIRGPHGAAHAGGACRRSDQRLLRVPADGFVSHAHSIHRRRAGVQYQLHDLQRHGAASGHDADSRVRIGDGTGAADDRLWRAGAGGEPLGRPLWRPCASSIVDRPSSVVRGGEPARSTLTGSRCRVTLCRSWR